MKDQEPPAPPEIPPKLRLYRSEKIGLPFLFVLPALAILGVFGPGTNTIGARSGTVDWSAEYPARLRFNNSDRLVVRVQNRGQSSVSQVSLTFDSTYIHAFSQVAFDPAPDKSYVLNIENLQPGEARLVAVQLTAEEYGSHEGWIHLSADGAETQIGLSTFIFP